jgi:hypothetical protein
MVMKSEGNCAGDLEGRRLLEKLRQINRLRAFTDCAMGSKNRSAQRPLTDYPEFKR